jgi:hypothetical protein
MEVRFRRRMAVTKKSIAERVGTERIRTDERFLYVVGERGYVLRIELPFSESSRKSRVSRKKVSMDDGFRYFLDSKGFVARIPIKSDSRRVVPSVLRRAAAA